MPVRYRRNRLLLILCLCLVVIVYWRSNSGDHQDQDADHAEVRRKPVERIIDIEDGELPKQPVKLSTTVRSTTRPVREEFVEIDGKKYKKIDWHDYEAIAREEARTGPGENGAGLEPSAKEWASGDFQRLYRENGFNAFISNNISLDRSVKDIRHPA